MAGLHDTAALPGLGSGLVDLEDLQPPAELGMALGQRVEPRTENHILNYARGELLADQVLDEPRTGNDRCPETPGAVWVHVAALAPIAMGCGQLEADDIFEHVRIGVDFHVQ